MTSDSNQQCSKVMQCLTTTRKGMLWNMNRKTWLINHENAVPDSGHLLPSTFLLLYFKSFKLLQLLSKHRYRTNNPCHSVQQVSLKSRSLVREWPDKKWQTMRFQQSSHHTHTLILTIRALMSHRERASLKV